MAETQQIKVAEILGSFYQDTVTGFMGVAVAMTFHLGDNPSILLQPAGLTTWQEPQWFPLGRVRATQPKPQDTAESDQ